MATWIFYYSKNDRIGRKVILMITLETLCINLPQITPQEVQFWIEKQWIRPEEQAGSYVFHEIDEARIRLIIELRDDFGVTDDAIPVVLQLLDQLYTTRRQMRYLCEVITTDNYPNLREKIRHMINNDTVSN